MIYRQEILDRKTGELVSTHARGSHHYRAKLTEARHPSHSSDAPQWRCSDGDCSPVRSEAALYLVCRHQAKLGPYPRLSASPSSWAYRGGSFFSPPDQGRAFRGGLVSIIHPDADASPRSIPRHDTSIPPIRLSGSRLHHASNVSGPASHAGSDGGLSRGLVGGAECLCRAFLTPNQIFRSRAIPPWPLGYAGVSTKNSSSTPCTTYVRCVRTPTPCWTINCASFLPLIKTTRCWTR